MSKIGDVIVKMLLKSDDYEKGLARSKKSTQSFSKSITKGFTAAIGKVTALVGAIAGIGKALEKVSSANQTFGDRWQSFTSGLKGAWDEFARSVASLDFTNIFTRLREASDAARDLYDAVDGMGEITTSYNIASARQAKQLSQLRVEMMNQNKTLDERIAAGEKYLGIVKELEKMPLRGLSRVSDATIAKTMTQMGYSFDGLTEKQIAIAKKSFIQFFEWLGTEAGEKAYKKLNAAYDGGKGVATGRYSRTFQAMESRGEAPGGRTWLQWLVQYADKVSDEDRKALEDAVVQFYKADAAFDESTRRIQTTLNNLYYQRDKKSTPGSTKSTIAAVDDGTKALKDQVNAMREVMAEVEAMPKIPEIVAQVSENMPDLVTDEWLARQKAQFARAKEEFDTLYNKCSTVADLFGDAVRSGFVSSLDELTNALGSGEKIDGGQLVKTLLSPLADACISAGVLIMTTGKGVEALRDTLITGLATGGVSAIAAGATLVAVGAAAKAGLAAIASSGSGSTTASPAYSSASSSSNTTKNIQTEMTVYVKGKISGGDIVLSGQRTINSWNR